MKSCMTSCDWCLSKCVYYKLGYYFFVEQDWSIIIAMSHSSSSFRMASSTHKAEDGLQKARSLHNKHRFYKSNVKKSVLQSKRYTVRFYMKC